MNVLVNVLGITMVSIMGMTIENVMVNVMWMTIVVVISLTRE